MTMSNEERIARLEAGFEHLATKADVENLRGDVNSGLSSVRGDFKSDIGAAQADYNSPDRPAVLGSDRDRRWGSWPLRRQPSSEMRWPEL